MEERGVAKGNSGQQTRSRTQCRRDLSRALDRVREAAEKDRWMQFNALWHHVYNVDRLRECYLSLKRQSAPGVDDVTWEEYGRDLEANLVDLSGRLRRGAFRAHPVRRTYVPKHDGGQRPIGIPVLEDKIVQRATVEVLSAVYEVDFLGFSYGFRQERSAHDALNALSVGIMEKRVNWVLDADIRGFFDAISHGWLDRFVEHRIADKRVQRHVKKWLNAGVLEEGRWHAVTEGTPQGGSISPLLANLYLHHVFDLWAHDWRKREARGDMILVRYADDFIVGFEHESDAQRFLAALKLRFARFNLELHPEKTRLLEFGRFAAVRRERRGQGKPETFDFLGFTHYCSKTRKGRFVVKRKTMRARLQRKLQELKVELRRRRHEAVRVTARWLTAVLRGHFQYYAVPFNYASLGQFRWTVVRAWFRELRRRGERRRLTWRRFAALIKAWLPQPRILHPYPSRKLLVSTRGRSPVR